jgi:hypothetical protein
MRPNHIPQQYFDYSKSVGGVDNCPGYASGGGTIFNRLQYMDSYERALSLYLENFDDYCKINKIYGWQDFLFQYVMMLAGYEIIQNTKLCEHWEVPNYDDFEILTACKDHNLITL